MGTDLANAVKAAPKITTIENLFALVAKDLSGTKDGEIVLQNMKMIIGTSCAQNPSLRQCTPESLFGGALTIARFNLDTSAGRAYLLPFMNKKKIGNDWVTEKNAQVVIGYKGLVSLFYRHGAALSLDMQTVHKNDGFSYQHGTESFLKHCPAMTDRGDVIGYYAVAKLKGGASVFRFMSREDAEAHGKKHSKTFNRTDGKFYDSSPWAKEFDAMAMKTVLIQLAKLLPLSIELQRAISIDETSRDYRAGVTDAMDLPDKTAWTDTTATPSDEVEFAPEVKK